MKTIFLLLISNIFMTIAWYGHLKFESVPLWKAILVSWLIAFVEYLFMVPANRLGKLEGMSGYQLKNNSRGYYNCGILFFCRFRT
jgi:uncharacterized protein (DUF486 family)